MLHQVYVSFIFVLFLIWSKITILILQLIQSYIHKFKLKSQAYLKNKQSKYKAINKKLKTIVLFIIKESGKRI